MSDDAKRAMQSAALQCQWIAWRAVSDGDLALDLPADNCCDMRGAIDVAKALCPRVRNIAVYVAGKPDVLYRRKPGTDSWAAYDLGRRGCGGKTEETR